MTVRMSVLITLVCMLCLPAPSGAADDAAAAAGSSPAAAAAQVDAETIARWMSDAQEHYNNRADVEEAKRAAALYEQVVAEAPDNFEAWWRLARACWWVGDHVPKPERLAVFERGRAAAEQAMALNPDRREGHYWQGVCMGRIGEEQGILNSLFMVDPIARAMERVLAINPEDGEAQHVLGLLYRKAPGWPLSRGDLNKALAYGRQAVANTPDQVNVHVGLAETLINANQRDEARRLLEHALTLPGPADEQPETAEDKEEARRILATLDR